MLAERFGGGPAYWLDPELDERLIATAVHVATRPPKGRTPRDE